MWPTEKRLAGLGAEPMPVRSLRENGSDAERGVFVHAVRSAVSARRESLCLMTGGSGLFKTKKKKKVVLQLRHLIGTGQ